MRMQRHSRVAEEVELADLSRNMELPQAALEDTEEENLVSRVMQEMSRSENDRATIESRVDKRRCEVYLNIFIIAIVMMQPSGDCGIPIRLWLSIYFLISSVQAVSYILN